MNKLTKSFNNFYDFKALCNTLLNTLNRIEYSIECGWETE